MAKVKAGGSAVFIYSVGLGHTLEKDRNSQETVYLNLLYQSVGALNAARGGAGPRNMLKSGRCVEAHGAQMLMFFKH